MITNTWLPLYTIERAGLDEVTVFGAWAAWSADQLVASVGGDAQIFGRSLMKPLQMKVFAADLEHELSGEAKALSVASHAGQDFHLKILQTMVDAKTEAYRQVPPQHTCSGKHTAILRGCERRGWPLDSYLSAEHPYHKALLACVRDVLGYGWAPQITAIDGCGLPTISMTVIECAKLYASLARGRERDWIFQAMTAHPLIVGGTHRLDTTVMTIGNGRVLAKEGADGLLGLAILDEKFPQGLGVVIKISSGYDQTALAQVAREILRGFGYELSSTDLFHLRPLVARADLKINKV